MSDKSGYHRPLMGGITVMPKKGDRHKGKLTGVATRTNGEKVLVTRLHLVSTEDWNVNVGDSIYQGGTEESNRVGQL